MYKETFDRLIETRDGKALESHAKPAPIAKVGDLVICGQKYAYVTRIVHWFPDDPERPNCPIHAHWVAVQIKTDIGNRWWGYSLTDSD